MASSDNSARAALKADARPAYLTLTQAAERVSTPAESIRYWIHIGRLRAYKPGRQLLIRAEDLATLIESSEVGALREAKAKKARKARAA